MSAVSGSDLDSAQSAEAVVASFVAGFVRDDMQTPLAGHTVEIYHGAKESVQVGATPDASVVTRADGSFRIDGLRPGANTLRLIGPDQGDVFETCINRSAKECGTRLATEERRVNLMLPDEGLDRMSIVVRGHSDRLATFRIVDDANQAMAHCLFSIDGWDDELQLYSDAWGVVCEPFSVPQDLRLRIRYYASSADFVGRYDELHRELMSRRYGSAEIALESATPHQDLGTIVMPRVAGLALTLADGTSGQGIGDATVLMKCIGGGLPPGEERGKMDSDGSYIVWGDRPNGDYELDVSAPGYRPAHHEGVLVAGDGPQPLELILERL